MHLVSTLSTVTILTTSKEHTLHRNDNYETDLLNTIDETYLIIVALWMIYFLEKDTSDEEWKKESFRIRIERKILEIRLKGQNKKRTYTTHV